MFGVPSGSRGGFGAESAESQPVGGIPAELVRGEDVPD